MTEQQKRAAIDKVVDVDGHMYRILSLGVVNGDKVYAHLASTTESTIQRNGLVPRQMCDFIPVAEVLRPQDRVSDEEISTNMKVRNYDI